MTEQSNSAAERSAHVTRGEKEAPAEWPITMVPGKGWKLKSVAKLEARIADLEAAINAVHRHAMAQSGDRTFDQCSAALGYIDDICRAALAGGKDE